MFYVGDLVEGKLSGTDRVVKGKITKIDKQSMVWYWVEDEPNGPFPCAFDELILIQSNRFSWIEEGF